MKNNDTPSIERLKEFREFLCGAAPLDGAWFGDEHGTGNGRFWWRKEFRRLIDATLETLTPSAGEGVEPWIVWSNEHRAFWAPNRRGYTGVIEKAGRYTRAEAEAICRGAQPRANSTINVGTPPEICMPAPEAALTPSPPLEQPDQSWPMCRRHGDEIIIRVPISVVPISAEIAWERRYGEHNIAVVDADTFANELIRELNKEAEDGTTLIHTMLDNACVNAVENGAEGLSDD